MGEYLYPGVYVEEKKFGTPPMDGGSTSTGAFVGFMPRGPVSEPFFVTSWTDFVNKTSLGADSPYMANSYLAYAVYGFFNNGGKRAWIVRATDGTEAKASISVANGTAGNEIVFTAKDAGTWANKLKVKIVENVDFTGTYDVEVYKEAELIEVHRQLSLTGGTYNFVAQINEVSKYVDVDTDATAMDATSLDSLKALAGGTDGISAVTSTHLIEAMKKFDLVDSINLLVVPESQANEVALEAVAYAEKRKDCVFIADAGMSDDFAAVQAFKQAFASEFMALYYPWVEVVDPIGTVKKNKYVPNAGHVAGMIARIDTNRGVFKAPAGTEAGLRGVLGVKTKINDQEQGILNPKGINVIRSFPDTGIIVWGARTTASTYLNVRRELNFIMGAIFQSTKWAVFEANNADLWRKIRNQLVSFLETRRVLGAYKGAGEGDAYFVKCDGELNTQAEVDAGRVNTDVGVAINKPGEFIIFRVGQWDGGGSVA
jgi:uncharacterized protein